MPCSRRWIDKNSKEIQILKYIISIHTYANTHVHKYTGLTMGLTVHKIVVAGLKREYLINVPKLH